MSALRQTKISTISVRVNDRIRAPEVRVIDAEGEMLGIMPTATALDLARSANLDLIEISPKAVPPVAKILSYDKYRYQLEKAARQHRKHQKKIEVKGIRLSMRIAAGDLEFKARQAEKFLGKGSKVRVEMFLRGRERANLGYAFEVLKKFLASLKAQVVVEQAPKKLGNVISAVIGPKGN